MDREAMNKKDTIKIEIPSHEAETISPTSGNMSSSGLSRQGSINTRYSCLCSPTTHAGSFRCRLHRSPSLQRTKSIEPQSKVTRTPSTVN